MGCMLQIYWILRGQIAHVRELRVLELISDLRAIETCPRAGSILPRPP